MKRIAYSLMGFGVVGALLVKFITPQNSILIVLAGAPLIIGLTIYVASALVRLFRGKVRLRPFDAIRQAAIMFPFFIAANFAVGFLFPSYDRGVGEILMFSGLLAIGIGLTQTAYRKPE